MIWIKYTIHTTTADCELVCATLTDYGITDVQIENNIQLTDEEMNQMYADFVKELPEDDGSCTISFYLDEQGFIPEGIGTGDSPGTANEEASYQGVFVDIEQVKQGLSEDAQLFGISPVTWESAKVDTQDWNRKWKEYFHPFSVGSFLIKPTWEPVPEDAGEKIVLDIDPGMAFGTGMHETTRLCLTALEQSLRADDTVIDLGTGSGILGIAALKMGASHVTAVDIDAQAVAVARDNFVLNGCGEEDSAYQLLTGNILQEEDLVNQLASEPADVVLANILADVIIPLSGFVHRLLKTGGSFLASGILDTKEEEVLAALRRNTQLTVVSVQQDGDWREITAIRK